MKIWNPNAKLTTKQIFYVVVKGNANVEYVLAMTLTSSLENSVNVMTGLVHWAERMTSCVQAMVIVNVANANAINIGQVKTAVAALKLTNVKVLTMAKHVQDMVNAYVTDANVIRMNPGDCLQEPIAKNFQTSLYRVNFWLLWSHAKLTTTIRMSHVPPLLSN